MYGSFAVPLINSKHCENSKNNTSVGMRLSRTKNDKFQKMHIMLFNQSNRKTFKTYQSIGIRSIKLVNYFKYILSFNTFINQFNLYSEVFKSEETLPGSFK